MSHIVQMPALGESVTEGTVTRWLKSVGDQVTEDEPLVEVSTDKVDTEIPAPYSGILEQILVEEDATASVGADLAVIGDGSGAGAAPAAAPAAEPAAAPAAASETEPATAAPTSEPIAEPDPATPAPMMEPAPPATATPDTAASAGTEITMPAMGESVSEGTITRWMKQVGDAIAVDEPIVEIATDKVDAEVPSPVAGTLLQIIAQEDDTVEVGSVLAMVGAADSAPAAPAAPASPPLAAATPSAAVAPEPASAPPAAPAAPAAPAPSATPPSAPVAPAAPAATGHSGYVTPVVRKLAADRGVDLATVVGTGVGGRIRREDVLAAATPLSEVPTTVPVRAAVPSPAVPAATPAAPVAAPATVRTAPVTAGAATAVVEVDATRVITLVEKLQRGSSAAGLSVLPFVVKAAIEAAQSVPAITAQLQGETVTYPDSINVAIEVAAAGGVIAPVIARAAELNTAGLAHRITQLTNNARQGALSPTELFGATFTVANSDAVGLVLDTGSFTPPQAARLSVGAVVKRPVVVTDDEAGDVIAVRATGYLTLVYDTRIIDAAAAAAYLTTVKRRIENSDFDSDFGL